MELCVCSGNFFYRKSTIGTTIAAIDANNDTYFLQKRIEKFPLDFRLADEQILVNTEIPKTLTYNSL